MKVMLYIK